VARLLAAVLDAPDPTGGLLPHNLLFAADALAELERPPAEIVRRVATGLIRAYRRENESRFAVLEERVKRAFGTLPRTVDHQDPVGEAMCAALIDSPAGEEGRFTRMAAAELAIDCEWYTPDVARALTEAWCTCLEPAGTLLTAIQYAYEAYPDHFSSRLSTFRRAVEREDGLWETIQSHTHWAAVVRALYLAPWAELEVKSIVRDSPLTEDLLALLREAPSERERLVALLEETFAAPERGEVARRDAGVALAHLGERVLVSWLVAASGEDRPLMKFKKIIR
jgi:hypothetical protein